MIQTVCLIVIATILMAPYMNCAPKHASDSLSSQINQEEVLKSLQSQSLNILQSKCATCHTLDFADSNLKNILDIDYLESARYIIPGSPQTSPLYLRIIDGLMPPDGSPSPTFEETGILRDWIAALGGNFNTLIGGVVDVPGQETAIGRFTQVANIIQQRCAGCHSGQTRPNLTLPHAQLLNETTQDGSRVIVPRDVDQSRLYQAVVANSMPRGQAPLTNTHKEIIRSWKAAGAAND